MLQFSWFHPYGWSRRLQEFRRLGMVVLIAVASTAVAGCGGDDNGGSTGPTDPPPPTEPDLGDFPAGKFELVVEEGDAPAAFLEGHFTMEIQSDGDFFVTHESGNVVGEVSVDGAEITLRDIGGELACNSPQQSGTYRWTETDATVTFSVVSDGCDGRRFVMLYRPWNKR